MTLINSNLHSSIFGLSLSRTSLSTAFYVLPHCDININDPGMKELVMEAREVASDAPEHIAVPSSVKGQA